MLGSILVFLIVLSVLILFHELGHFLVAKKSGVWVEEFGFGLPPRIFGKKIGNTLYSINLLPFGGFVRLHGENTDEGVSKPKKAFLNKGKLTRALIVTAGVIMNVILAVICFAFVYSFAGIPRNTDKVKILDVAASSPAQVAGILVGDIVKNIDKTKVSSTEEFIRVVDEKKGKKITLEVEREENGKTAIKKFLLTPRQTHPADEGPLGVTISSTEIYFPPIWQRPFIGIYYGVKEALFWGKTVILGLFKIFVDLFGGKAPTDVAGPIGIFAITSEAAKMGALAVINFIGILSINLAILNILPIPAFDGGRLLFIGIEMVLGRKVLPKLEAAIHTIGMIILIFLSFVIAAYDIKRLVASGSLSGFINMFVR